MKNKVLVAAVCVLSAALALETGYLIGKGRAERSEIKPAELGHPVAPKRGLALPKQIQAVNPIPRARVSEKEWDPFEEMYRMQKVMNRMFNDSFGRGSRLGGDVSGGSWVSFDPAVDVKEQDDAYIVVVDLPGVDKDTINISAQPNSVTVSGERVVESEERDGTGGFYRSERSFGSFQRTIPLMKRVSPGLVTAETREGVLMIKLPKEKTSENEEHSAASVKIR
ncbi:MAG: Hsp20/alpha crystallin family protein [Candidatus Omnitrophica bacterium]|nr:Hsp20/alpha crystallin family protein [Candidatus Omnitrophota bacterium]